MGQNVILILLTTWFGRWADWVGRHSDQIFLYQKIPFNGWNEGPYDTHINSSDHSLCVSISLQKTFFNTGEKGSLLDQILGFFLYFSRYTINWRVELKSWVTDNTTNSCSKQGKIICVRFFFLFWTFDNFHFILKCIFAAFCDRTLEFILLSVIVYTSLGSINIFPKFQYGFLECNTCHVFEQNMLSLQVYLSVFTRRSKYMVENIIIFPSSYTKYSSAFLIRLPNSNLS